MLSTRNVLPFVFVATVSLGPLGGCGTPAPEVPDAGEAPDAGEVPDAGGAPLATISATPLAFGEVGCGTTATRELSVKNTGTAPLTFTTSLGGATHYGVTPAEGTVEAGGEATVTVSATPAATSSAGAELPGMLVLTTNDPASATVEVPLTQVAAGVTLTLTPDVASFGVLPVNTPAPARPLTLTNTGNVAATLTFAQPADDQFSLDWTGAPAAVTVAPGSSVPGLSAGFRASRITPGSTSAAITVAEAVCGTSVASIPMTGQGTNGVVGFSTTDVFFGTGGKVDCGTRAGNQTFNITNTGTQAFAWTGTLAKGTDSPFTFSPTSGIVPANGGSNTITVSTTAIPAEADTATDAFGDTLSIVTDVASDTNHAILLHQTANGAVLAFEPTTVDFGLVPINNTSDAPFSVVNRGSATANVTLASSNGRFTLNPAGPTPVAAGSTASVTGTFAPGTSVDPETSAVTMTLDAADVLCAPLPGSLTLTGTGTSGSVSFSPAAIDFGGVNCGTTAPARTVTFSNEGNQDYTISATLGRGAGSPFAIALDPATGVVAANGGTVVITVTPSAIPATSAVTPDLYGDTLTVPTDVTDDPPHAIPLRQTARGAIFALSATALNFGSVAVGATATAQFTASNTGNAPGTLSYTAGQPTIFSLPQNAVVDANSSAAQSGSFSPSSAASFSDTATITAAATTVLCQPLPFTTISLSGTGTSGNVVAVSASRLTFGTAGRVPCGTQAAPKTVEVSNNSSQLLTIALTLAEGTASAYTVSGPTTIAAGESGTVTVTPNAIPATASTEPDAFADTLSIAATGGPVNETHTVLLHQTAQGAILSFSPAALSFSVGLGGSQSKNFTVNNAGNLAAPYTLTVGGPNATNFTVSPTSGSAAAGSSASETVTFSSPVSGGFGDRNGTVSLATTAGLCAPVPAALPLNGTVAN